MSVPKHGSALVDLIRKHFDENPGFMQKIKNMKPDSPARDFKIPLLPPIVKEQTTDLATGRQWGKLVTYDKKTLAMTTTEVTQEMASVDLKTLRKVQRQLQDESDRVFQTQYMQQFSRAHRDGEKYPLSYYAKALQTIRYKDKWSFRVEHLANDYLLTVVMRVPNAVDMPFKAIGELVDIQGSRTFEPHIDAELFARIVFQQIKSMEIHEAQEQFTFAGSHLEGEHPHPEAFEWNKI